MMMGKKVDLAAVSSMRTMSITTMMTMIKAYTVMNIMTRTIIAGLVNMTMMKPMTLTSLEVLRIERTTTMMNTRTTMLSEMKVNALMMRNSTMILLEVQVVPVVIPGPTKAKKPAHTLAILAVGANRTRTISCTMMVMEVIIPMKSTTNNIFTLSSRSIAFCVFLQRTEHFYPLVAAEYAVLAHDLHLSPTNALS